MEISITLMKLLMQSIWSYLLHKNTKLYSNGKYVEVILLQHREVAAHEGSVETIGYYCVFNVAYCMLHANSVVTALLHLFGTCCKIIIGMPLNFAIHKVRYAHSFSAKNLTIMQKLSFSIV